MAKQVLRYTGTLYALQAVFGGIVFLLSDFRWIALTFSLIFLGLVLRAGSSFAADGGGPAGAVLTGLLWQVPGLQGTLRFISDRIGWTQYDGTTDLMDFAMETWHTVVLPQVGSIPPGLVDQYFARYYIALVAGSPLLALLFTLGAWRLGANFLVGKRESGKY